jgi:SAM-dependent methyltransferase
MGRWSRSLAPLFVRFTGVRDGDTVLDVGSGTGALAASVAKMAPSSRIVGIDPAAPYVALAQSQHGSPLIHFDVGDAQQMRLCGVAVGLGSRSAAREPAPPASRPGSGQAFHDACARLGRTWQVAVIEPAAHRAKRVSYRVVVLRGAMDCESCPDW